MLAETELEQSFEQRNGGNMVGCLAKALLMAVFGTLVAGVFLGVVLFDVLAQVLR